MHFSLKLLSLKLLVKLLFCLGIALCRSNVYHITPSQGSQVSPGLTLSQLAANLSNSDDFQFNIMSMILFSGSHLLQMELLLSNVTAFSMAGDDHNSSSTRIVCSPNSTLTFTETDEIEIVGIEFVGCSITFQLIKRLFLKECVVSGINTAVNAGLEVIETNAVIKWSSFISNYVRGAITLVGSNLTIIECNLTDNHAKVGGAILSRRGGTINITACQFVGNKATGCADHQPEDCKGGALHVDDGIIVICGSTFINNTSEGNGGAISVSGILGYSVQNIFQYNQASLSGGVAPVFSCRNFTVDNGSFHSNVAHEDGGVVFASGSNIFATSNMFLNNKASGKGGAMFADHRSNLLVSNSLFNNNKAVGAGGAIYEQTNCNITVENSTFSNNSAGNGHENDCNDLSFNTFDGGALSARNGSIMLVSSSTFYHNQVFRCHGGAISAHFGSIIEIENSYFEDNIAGKCGGAVYAYTVDYNHTMLVNNSTFNSNIGNYHGGALCPHTHINLLVIHSSFNRNSAHGQGGAILTYKVFLTLDHCVFLDNQAKTETGGAVYVNDRSNATVTNSVFYNNQAMKIGGGISVRRNSNIEVVSSTFIDNVAKLGGGAIGVRTFSGDIISDSHHK